MRLKRFSIAVMVLLAALLVSACGQSAAQAQKADEEKLLAAIYKEFEMFEANDAAGLMDLFADDAVSLPPGSPAIEGKDAIAAGKTAFLENNNVKVDFKLVDYKIVGDYATRQGEWTMYVTPKAGGETMVNPGKCMLGWEKIGGEWKIVWEIFNPAK